MNQQLILWWQSLSNRERWIVGIGAAICAFLLVDRLLWRSWQNYQQNLLQTVTEQTRLLTWLNSVKPLLSGAQQNGVKSDANSNAKDTLSVLDQSLQQQGLRTLVTQFEERSENTVVVGFATINFDAWIDWLSILQKNYGLQVQEASIHRLSEPGMVQVVAFFAQHPAK